MEKKDNVTTLYCELLTNDDIIEFEELMVSLGYDEIDRPARWAKLVPYWYAKGLPRGEGDDPLAVVILSLFHDESKFILHSAYRSVTGRKISHEMMKIFIMTVGYDRKKWDAIKDQIVY